MMYSRTTLTVVTALLILGLLGWGIHLRLQSGDAARAQAALPTSAGQQFSTEIAQPVSGATVVRDTLWITVTAAGQAEAFRRATVVARVAGIVREVPVRENGQVRLDQTVVAIDTSEYALAVARAQGDMLNAEVVFRELVLFDDEIADAEVRQERARLARSRSGLNQAEVALRQAEMDLDRARVPAPFPGRVANLRVVPGQHVAQGAELLTVVDIDPVKVEVQVLEAEIGYLAEGRRATVSFAAFPGESFSGRIETLNPVVDPDTRTARATILLPNRDGRIKPGMYARVSLEAQHFTNRILVPRTAILERDRRTMLFVFSNGKAEWRYVTTGRESDTLVEIVAHEDTFMVEPGEIVLVGGHQYLVHDARVELVESTTASTGRPGA